MASPIVKKTAKNVRIGQLALITATAFCRLGV